MNIGEIIFITFFLILIYLCLCLIINMSISHVLDKYFNSKYYINIKYAKAHPKNEGLNSYKICKDEWFNKDKYYIDIYEYKWDYVHSFFLFGLIPYPIRLKTFDNHLICYSIYLDEEANKMIDERDAEKLLEWCKSKKEWFFEELTKQELEQKQENLKEMSLINFIEHFNQKKIK